jgi:hypothetical protein
MKKKVLSMTLAVALSLSMGITAFAAPEVIQANGTTIVFDSDYYATNNPDVVAAYGTDKEALLQHYLNNGMSEGRAAYDPTIDISALLGINVKAKEKTGKPIKQEIKKYGSGSYDTVYYTYDTQGNLINKSEYSDSGLLTQYYEYIYDALGNKIEYNRYSYQDRAGGLVLLDVYDYTYDVYGNLVKEMHYVATNGVPNLYDVVIYEYDQTGRLIKKMDHDNNHADNSKFYDNCYETYDYIYDESGNVVRVEQHYTYFDEYETTYTTIYEYDANNNVIKKTVNWSGNNPYCHHIYEYVYDSQGNMLSDTKYQYIKSVDGFVLNESHEYTYDSEGDVIKDVHTFPANDGYATHIYTYQY